MTGRRRNLGLEDPFLFLELLARKKIPFVIVGGAALALHGIPRSTLDIDLIIPATDPVVPRLFSAARHAGFRSRQRGILKVAHSAMWSGQWVTFQDARGREWVDVFLERPQAFARLLKNSVRRGTKQIRFYVAGLKAIEKMKRQSGRPIDWADIALIREKRKGVKTRQE